MDEESELSWLQEKFRIAVEFKTQHIHRHLRELFQEYRGNNLLALADQLADTIDERTVEFDAAIKNDGRIPILNVLVRKCGALLTSRRPDMTVINRSPRDEAIADLVGRKNEQRLDEIKFDRTIKRITLLALLSGTGVAKVGYGSTHVYGQTDWADKIPRGSEYADNQDLNVIPYGTRTEYTNVMNKPDGPLVIPVPITDIFFDSGTRSLFPEGPAYIFHRTTRRLGDVVRDSRYSNEFKKQVSGNEEFTDQMESTYLTQEWNHQEEAEQSVDMIECFSASSRQFCIFSYDCSAFAVEWTDIGLDIANPYHFFQPIPDPESPYGIPYAGLIVPSAKACNHTRQVHMAKLDRDGKTVNLYDSTILQDQAIVMDLQKAEDGAYIGIPGLSNMEQGRLLQQLTFGGTSPELLQNINMHQQDANWASQLTDAARNAMQGDQTATEAQLRQEQQNVSIEDMRFWQEEFIEDIGKDLLKIELQYWGPEEIIKVTGNDPRIYFYIKVERERVRKDFTLKVLIGSSDAAKSIVSVQQAKEIIQVVADLNMQYTQERMMSMQGVPPGVFNYPEAMRWVLELADRRAADRILRRQDPMELMARLLQQHNMAPIPQGVSPMLEQLILSQARQRLLVDEGILNPAQGAMGEQPGMGGDFNERNRVPQSTGRMPMAGQMPGRIQSEAMGAAV